MEIPFRLTDDITGDPVTDLVKADVVLKLADTPYTIMPYTDLGAIGSAKGEYVLWGVNFYPATCRLWIKGVVQDNWFGAQEIGNFALKYALTGDLNALNDLTVKLAGGNSISGTNAFVQAAPVSYVTPTATDHLTRKDYVDNAIATAVGIPFSTTSNLTWSGYNTFTKKISLSGGTGVSDGNKFWNRNDFMDQAPYSNYLPLNNSQLANKYYVDSEITTRINTMGSGLAFQESVNVIRLIPNGTTTGTCYATWTEALTYANANASNTRNITVQLPGNGTVGSIGMSLTGKDCVHFLGTGENIIINVASQGFGAKALGLIIYDNVTFYMDDSENPFSFSNLVFNNCKFNVVQSDGSPIFSGCKFTGGNEFIGNAVQFLNCQGERVLCSTQPTISGTNKLQYYTSAKMTIGTIGISDVGGNLTLASPAGFISGGGLVTNGVVTFNSAGTDSALSNEFSDFRPNQYFGTDINFVLTKPSGWVNITIEGTPYALPLYEIA